MTNYTLIIEDLHRLAHRLLEYEAYGGSENFFAFLKDKEPEQGARLMCLYTGVIDFYAKTGYSYRWSK